MNVRTLSILLHAILGAAAVAAFVWALEARHAAGALPLGRALGFGLAALAWGAGWVLLLVHDGSARAHTRVEVAPAALADALGLPALASDTVRTFAVVVFAYGVLALVFGGS